MRGIIFDFDGTILDTEHAHYAAWQSIYQQHGQVLPLDKYSDSVGTDDGDFDPLIHLQRLLGKSIPVDGLEKNRRQKFNDLLTELKPMPGVLDWIHGAKEVGLKLAIASNSTANWVKDHLQRFNILHLFDVIATRDDVQQIKPNPEVYQVALKKLKLTTTETIAIEDSLLGVTAALAAGIQCIAVPNKILSHLTFPETFLCVESLAQLNFHEVLERLKKLTQ